MLELEKQRSTQGTGAAAAAAASPTTTRLIRLYLDYSKERDLSKKWADSYQPLVDAHFEAAESYEHAQLIAEIGVVVASLGVLLASRSAWLLSVVLGIGSIGMVGYTSFHTKGMVGQHITKVEQGLEKFEELRKAHTAANSDELTVDALDPGRKLRGQFEQEIKIAEEHGAKSAEGAGHKE
jgi:hypothetical protein